MRSVLPLLLIPLLAGCLQAASAGCEPQPGVAQGLVLLDGEPVPGALVWWHRANLTHGAGGLGEDRAARAAGVLTDDGGRFALPGEGRELRVYAPGALHATVAADSCAVVRLAPDDLRVVGHRATGFHAPENTELAMRVAAAQGAGVLELDVRRTSDDVLVLWHDAGLERMSGLPLQVADVPWAVLDDLRVGPGEPQRVLRLEEALVVADELHREVVLDLKGSPRNVTRTLELVAPLLDARDAWGRVWLAVRYDSNIDECQALPEARCAVHRFGGGDPLRVPIERGVAAVSLRHTSVDAETVARAHQNGIEVWAWTVNLEEDWAAMLEAGVDGIVTDRPQELSDRVRTSARG